MHEVSRRRRTKARPLLTAGAGIAVALVAHCGGPESQTPPITAPCTDAGVCLPDGGPPGGAGSGCCHPADGGADGGG